MKKNILYLLFTMLLYGCSNNVEISSSIYDSTYVSDTENISSIISSTSIQWEVIFVVYDDYRLVCYVDDNTCVEPQEVKQDGYSFLGWYTEDNQLFDFDLPICEDLILYAKWELKFGPIV